MGLKRELEIQIYVCGAPRLGPFHFQPLGPWATSGSLTCLIHLAAVGFYKKYEPVFHITVQIPSRAH